MSEITFGRLTELGLREAWSHEALGFTPWLAENMDHLSDAVGIPLELTGTEIAVDTFAADILARNPIDGSVVLIENQLEQTDHTHLGQIMTYLAGLEAQTVIWIAPRFREPHLSAIRWLNAHTADGFSFFAVRLRVVRIGDSPFAPIFEVIEKPNDWDRQVKKTAKPSTDGSFDEKHAFWAEMAGRRPDLAAVGLRPTKLSNVWITLSDDPSIYLSVYIAKSESGVFLRGPRGAGRDYLVDALGPHLDTLEERLGVPFDARKPGTAFVAIVAKGWEDRSSWPEIMDWMAGTIDTYRAAVASAMTGDA